MGRKCAIVAISDLKRRMRVAITQLYTDQVEVLVDEQGEDRGKIGKGNPDISKKEIKFMRMDIAKGMFYS